MGSVYKTLTCNREGVLLILFSMQWRKPIITVAVYWQAVKELCIDKGSFQTKEQNEGW